jgi:hypothetical protein
MESSCCCSPEFLRFSVSSSVANWSMWPPTHALRIPVACNEIFCSVNGAWLQTEILVTFSQLFAYELLRIAIPSGLSRTDIYHIWDRSDLVLEHGTVCSLETSDTVPLLTSWYDFLLIISPPVTFDDTKTSVSLLSSGLYFEMSVIHLCVGSVRISRGGRTEKRFI